MTTSTPQEIAAIVAAVRAAERQVYDTEDIMKMFGIRSRCTVSDWIKFGKLPRRDMGQKWRKATVDQYLRAKAL